VEIFHKHSFMIEEDNYEAVLAEYDLAEAILQQKIEFALSFQCRLLEISVQCTVCREYDRRNLTNELEKEEQLHLVISQLEAADASYTYKIFSIYFIDFSNLQYAITGQSSPEIHAKRPLGHRQSFDPVGRKKAPKTEPW